MFFLTKTRRICRFLKPSGARSYADGQGVAANRVTAALCALAHPPMPVEVCARSGRHRHRFRTDGMFRPQVCTVVLKLTQDKKPTTRIATPAEITPCAIISRRAFWKILRLRAARGGFRMSGPLNTQLYRTASQTKDYCPALDVSLAYTFVLHPHNFAGPSVTVLEADYGRTELLRK